MEVEADTKNNKWFETNHLSGDLKSHSISGGFNTILAQLVSFIINISSTIVLARLLTPEDYGLVAMVTAVTGFVSIFKDMGLSAAIIQKKELNQNQVSSVFWINCLVSLGIAIIVAFTSSLLVNFYNEQRLFNITLVFALSIFLTGLSLQHNALMKRQMKFKTLSKINIISSVTSLITGIILAWKGFGYWAIVATTICPPLYSTIALWIACDWRPHLEFKTKNTKSILSFGAGLTGFDLVNYFSRNMDNVLIGKFVGSNALGIYSKAYQLLLLPITQLRDPLNTVALPALSSLQSDKWKYNHFFRRYLFTLAFFSMPLVVYCAVFSEEIISVILGEKWLEASYVFKLLAIAAFIQPVASTQGLLLITTGQSRRYFVLGIMGAICNVTGFIIGVNWGMEGVAIAYALVTYTLFIPFLIFSLKDSHMTLKHFLSEISYPALFSILVGVVFIYVKPYFSHVSAFLCCALGLIFGGLLYLCFWFINKHTKEKLKNILEIGNFLLKKYGLNKS